jgi:hypothetical protein
MTDDTVGGTSGLSWDKTIILIDNARNAMRSPLNSSKQQIKGNIKREISKDCPLAQTNNLLDPLTTC